jgi:hypothetical protein
MFSRQWAIAAVVSSTFLVAACDRPPQAAPEGEFTRPGASDVADEPAGGARAAPATSGPPPAVDTADAAAARSAPSESAAADAAAAWSAPSESAAADAAAAAPDEPGAPSREPGAAGDPCERSFNTLKVLARAANRAVPARVDYLRACSALSPEMQTCLEPAYRADHEVECYEAHTRTDRDDLARLERVVEGAAP